MLAFGLHTSARPLLGCSARIGALSGKPACLPLNVVPTVKKRLPARWCCSSSAGKGFGKTNSDSEAEVLIDTMGALSKASGREAKTTNMVLGEGSWEEMDAKVNEYPQQRKFQAIGSGGEDFVRCMVEVVERTLSVTVTDDMVVVRPSKKGTYLSVNIGPVVVKSGDEVQAVYKEMKIDPRVKYML